MRHVFVCFFEEIEDSKKAFQNYLTFRLTTTSCTASQSIMFLSPAAIPTKVILFKTRREPFLCTGTRYEI